jgi:hypothetical protein
LEFADVPERLTEASGAAWDNLKAEDAFRRWEEIVFEWIVALVGSGADRFVTVSG